MPDLEKELKEVLEVLESKTASDKTVKSFESASERFEDLVAKGIVQKRGNHQLSIENAHLKRFSINHR